MSSDKLADKKLQKYGMCPHFVKFTSFSEPKYGSQPIVEKYCLSVLCVCVYVLYVLGCLSVSVLFV